LASSAGPAVLAEPRHDAVRLRYWLNPRVYSPGYLDSTESVEVLEYLRARAARGLKKASTTVIVPRIRTRHNDEVVSARGLTHLRPRTSAS
jgi:hypothetical protein